ncbi:exodeoxyribonuclease V subunit alpha [Agitococcus lubricus]|uniref:RecBCD enzyme subunit RecD n=1 Tax=Agitococcus lubricus TaxID=1077255 RepID=A0A2T5J315_9GAMM|nr:exodeoxyribonuclease V subunit alpha [Agitococcus lubricus]PTQ90962.1 DNA helicase/exodeoxyribonuclease V alpha subunit [Agitococcus lubricus]
MNFLQLPIAANEFVSAWAEGVASLMVRLHEGQQGNTKHSLRIAGYVRDLCSALDQGHTCLQDDHLTRLINYQSPIIALAEDALTQVKPLVLENNRLYLYRYWWDEYGLSQAIHRLNRPLTHTLLDEQLAQFTVGTHPKQRQAIEVALAQGFTVITGGPGTGKTFTLVRILLALVQSYGHGLRVALAAPTGKAAARMQEALRHSLSQLSVSSDVLSVLPDQAFTLHRLLGMGYSTQAKYHQHYPLPYDIVIVDEASMIDLHMAHQLFNAIPANARLILLGDANQLAAVEAGAVLAELSQAHTLRQNSVQLTESQRFGSHSGIGQLAAAICQGLNEHSLALLKQGLPDVVYHKTEQIDHVVTQLFQDYLAFVDALQQKQSPQHILTAFDQYRVLCAMREGSYGVYSLNQRLALLLQKALGQTEDPQQIWFHGRPVMVTQNDYGLNVFNGDIGITLAEEDGFYVYFPARDAQLLRIPAARLAHSETALALTIHKSQGSEFKTVAVVLPKEDSPILCRELLYTGITRAKTRVKCWATDALISHAITRKTQRASGLKAKLDNE